MMIRKEAIGRGKMSKQKENRGREKRGEKESTLQRHGPKAEKTRRTERWNGRLLRRSLLGLKRGKKRKQGLASVEKTKPNPKKKKKLLRGEWRS